MMQRALVLGLGESGLAMARWLARAGWEVVAADTRTEPPMLSALRERLPAVEFVAGAFSVDRLDGIGLLALSPGLSPHEEGVRALLAAAAQRGIESVGEIELFARALEALRQDSGYAPTLVGVTGTNGKTTTVRMVAQMIERAGRSVALAGNISPSALDALREALDAQQLPQAWVLELSSFQLASTSSLTCTAAAILNITQDHLDWHASMADYAACKQRIFAASTIRVLDRDAEPTRNIAIASAGTARVLTFGAGAPERAGQYGLVRDGGLSWLAYTDEDDTPRRKRRTPKAVAGGAPTGGESTAMAAPPPEPPHVHRLMPVDALAVRGTHNALNALAALALARAIGVPLAPALRALEDFRAEAHRTQTIAQIDGVEFIDDSKGTNVGATVAALHGLSGTPGTPRRILVILGGDAKGQSFDPLAEAVRGHCRAAILIGKDAPRIEEALRGIDVPVLRAADLPAAVRAGAELAQPGDLVLLSPACASFDMFRDYAHRAQVFVAAVRELAAARSAPREATPPEPGAESPPASQTPGAPEGQP
jgi:UDP-N-acetylmuramoylalanine--D-glutamate ligase